MSSKQLFAVAVAVSLIASVGTAEAGSYPTNKCVAAKQKAAGKFCQSALKSWSKFHKNPAADPGGSGRDAAIDAAAAKLADGWGKAETKAAKKGVDCAVTTVTAGEADTNMRSRVDDLQSSATAGLGAGDETCGAGILKAIGKLCAGVLKAEAKFIKALAKDPDRSGLAAAKSKVEGKFTSAYGKFAPTCANTPTDAATLIGDAGTASDATVLDVVSSPSLSTVFTQEIPPTEVDYKGKTLTPRCSRDTPYSFFYKRGTTNNLLVYYQGGGACWDFPTCWAAPVYKIDAGAGDNPDLVATGFADPNNPLNIFADWNVVFVSYCTGDVHWGEQKIQYGPGSITNHFGRVNAAVVEKFAREHFPSPDRVFVTGSSAGAYGAILNSTFLMDEVYPASDFGVLGDAGAGVITRGFLATGIGKWAVEKNLPTFVPGIQLPVSDLSLVEMYEAIANNWPQHRFAQYQSNYDGGNGGQTSFFHVMKAGLSASWWDHQCEWTACMRLFLDELHTRVPSNFRSYTSAGSRHTVYGSDKLYTDLTGPVPITIRDWVQAMVNDDVGWVNVDCLDGGDCDLVDTCQGGPNAGLACSSDPECLPLGTACVLSECVGGIRDTLACVDGSQCPDFNCNTDPRPSPLAAPYEPGGVVNCPATVCECYDPVTAPNGVNCPD